MENKFKMPAVALWVVNAIILFLNFLDVKKLYDEFRGAYGGYGGDMIKKEYHFYVFILILGLVGTAIACMGLMKMTISTIQIGLWIYSVALIISFIKSFNGIWRDMIHETGFALMLIAAILEVVAFVILAIKTSDAINLVDYAKYSAPGKIYIVAIALMLVGAMMVLSKINYGGIGLTDIVSAKEWLQLILTTVMLFVTGSVFSEYVAIERINKSRIEEEQAARHRAERAEREERYRKANEE